MRVISANLNGIRAAAKKGFFQWLEQQNADVVCLQETKAQMHILDNPELRPEGYHCYFHDAEKKGYSGVGIYTKQEPKKITYGLGWETADHEGRYVQADFNDLSIASLYLPSGSSSDERQQVKYDFMHNTMNFIKELRNKSQRFIICGDWNIAHKEIDLKNWKANQKNSGFLPEERAWMDQLFTEASCVDAFRVINQEAEQYTWWSNRGQAWAKNVGWRLDYQVISPCLQNKVKAVEIYRDEKFSDHAPLIIDYAL